MGTDNDTREKYTAIIAEYKELSDALKGHRDYQIESHAEISMTLKNIEKHLSSLNNKVATNVKDINDLKSWKNERIAMDKLIERIKTEEKQRVARERTLIDRKSMEAEKEKRNDRRLIYGILLGLVANLIIGILI